MNGMRHKNFSKGYEALPPALKKQVREAIIRDVFLVKNNQTFYNKKNGKENITEYEWSGIERVFNELGVDAKTGKVCQKEQL